MLASFKRLAYKCPWWAKNQHVNTICGAWRPRSSEDLAASIVVNWIASANQCSPWPGSIFCHPPQVEYERQEWRAPDGYPVQVDLLASKSAFTRGIVVLLHGLEQSSRGPMAMRQAHALAEAGSIPRLTSRIAALFSNITQWGAYSSLTRACSACSVRRGGRELSRLRRRRGGLG